MLTCIKINRPSSPGTFMFSAESANTTNSVSGVNLCRHVCFCDFQVKFRQIPFAVWFPWKRGNDFPGQLHRNEHLYVVITAQVICRLDVFSLYAADVL